MIYGSAGFSCLSKIIMQSESPSTTNAQLIINLTAFRIWSAFMHYQHDPSLSEKVLQEGICGELVDL